MQPTTLPQILFASRRDTPWLGYIPFLLVISSFLIIGLIQRGPSSELYLIAILLLAIVQTHFRSLLGWVVLLACAALYTLAALYQITLVFAFGNTANHAREFSLLFLLLGTICVIGLLLSHPWRRT